MTKLSARGRTELARVTLEKDDTASDLTEKARYTYALMSDRKVLSKLDVLFKNETRYHSYGWKIQGKLKADVTTEQWVANKLAKGYQRG